ncbi:MAG TPA: iron dicitrate transport regulator FecR, partial [Porphyromonadaceae bacterium]|nr:iron dicitrate transport regulator FecR [Porphyromonadaceae bacterium]
FQENVDIEIDNERTAQIKAGDNTEEKIAITQNTMNKLIVPYGKRSKIVLPDGTQVWLNSGSSLEFPSDFSGKTRDVYLSGEIYIEVAHDTQKLFRVHASGFDVKVYGTQFNVTAYPNSQPSVVLVQGSVSLQSENKPEIFLSPSEQALYSESGVFQTKKVDVTPFISWKNG